MIEDVSPTYGKCGNFEESPDLCAGVVPGETPCEFLRLLEYRASEYS